MRMIMSDLSWAEQQNSQRGEDKGVQRLQVFYVHGH